jgi:hypothetical protein
VFLQRGKQTGALYIFRFLRYIYFVEYIFIFLIYIFVHISFDLGGDIHQSARVILEGAGAGRVVLVRGQMTNQGD